MHTVTACIKAIIEGGKLQETVRKYAKRSTYEVRELLKIVRWMLTPEWLKARTYANRKQQAAERKANKETRPVQKKNYLSIKWVDYGYYEEEFNRK